MVGSMYLLFIRLTRFDKPNFTTNSISKDFTIFFGESIAYFNSFTY